MVILNTQIVSNLTVAGMIAIVFIIIGTYITILGYLYSEKKFFIISIFLSVIAITLILFGKITNKVTTHEVIINEPINISEFLSKYEIIDHRGEIFTIKELP